MRSDKSSPDLSQYDCRVRLVLDHVADKWTLVVLTCLGDGELRFTQLKGRIDGISQRMLTVTLRTLERDGIVKRTVYSAMPPNIAYRLTPLGQTLRTAIGPLTTWATEHLKEVAAAQQRYDQLQLRRATVI